MLLLTKSQVFLQIVVGQQLEEQSGSRQTASRIVQLERCNRGSQGHCCMGTKYCSLLRDDRVVIVDSASEDKSNLPAGFYYQRPDFCNLNEQIFEPEAKDATARMI